MSNLNYTLEQVASWAGGNSEVTIPALQRGLVWKPEQVELLWDSILRGFPIGSFLLADITEDNGQAGAKYYLMDGQQRYNAISIGYNTVSDPRAVLWIDLEPPTANNSTRRFWIKATTIPHPWGYKNDDNCSRLNTAEKRDAVEKFELGNETIYSKSFSLVSTWPVEAKCPIPLWCLLKSDMTDEESFMTQALHLFTNETDFTYRHRIVISDKAKKYLKDLYPVFMALNNYIIHCNHIPKEIIESETDTDSTEQTNLEVLFTRLNTGGTAISRDDLNYSAIKAYWPTIKDMNDKLAEKYMSPSKLAMLAFRLALTKDEDKYLRNELSIKQIRSYAKRDEKKDIEVIYSKLESVLYQVDVWLGVEENSEGKKTPPILRTLIARNSPEVYLLLMYFALKHQQSPIDLKDTEIRALAFILHWFSTGKGKKNCVQDIFSRCKTGINRENILMGISRLMHDCKLLHIYSPKEVSDFIKIPDSSDWRVWHGIPAVAREFFDRIFWYRDGYSESSEMLLYAERRYINQRFSNYDPARQDMWAEYNRPWDFDHIVAQNRIVGKHGHYREYNKSWLNSIGNIAAISLESNRSKSDRDDYQEYENQDLYYNREVETLCYDFSNDSKSSLRFAEITYKRFCEIYLNVYELLKPLTDDFKLSQTLVKRKTIFEEVAKSYTDAIFHFAASDQNDHILDRENDWAREWMGIGIERGDFMVCCEWSAVKNEKLEIGIRRGIGKKITKENKALLCQYAEVTNNEVPQDINNDWWYVIEHCDRLEPDTIISIMNKYLAYFADIHPRQ